MNILKFQTIVLLIFSLLPSSIYTLDSRDQLKVKEILGNILSHDYNSHIRPVGLVSGANSTYPTKVSVTFESVNVLSVDKHLGRMTFQSQFHQYWVDPRLAYNDTTIKYIPTKEIKYVWTPDLYFGNGLEASTPKQAQVLLIYPDGGIFYSTHLIQTFSCPLAAKEPKEVTCSTTLGPYGYSSQDIQVELLESNLSTLADTFVPIYSLDSVTTRRCDHTVKNEYDNTTEIYSCVALDFKFTHL